MRIAIAGGSGFVGQRLISHLLASTNFCIVSLSRHQNQNKADGTGGRLIYRAVDLHNLKSIEQSLEGIDVAIYLVHSMLPTARLNQGHFRDFDLSLADNFGRAAKKCLVKQVIYLSGLMPQSVNMSDHLLSRREVEKVLLSYIAQTTILRAGLILGSGGSSFTILLRLVDRLPVMVCPKWSQNRCQPVHIDDVVKSIAACIGKEETVSKVYDLGASDSVTYVELIRICADLLGKKRVIVSVPFLTSLVSRYWLQVITGAPKRLVYPLIESLKDSMLVRENHRLGLMNDKPRSVRELMVSILPSHNPSSAYREELPHAFRRKYSFKSVSSVRSIQRLPLPVGKDAYWVARQYIQWIDGLLPFLLDVRSYTNKISFRFFGFSVLELEHSPDRSHPDRQLFYVRGGLLAKSPQSPHARLEMRETLGGRAIIAAIHDFQPSLPWPLYRVSQAIAHRYVMARFSRYLADF